jgi:hypothetical protein
LSPISAVSWLDDASPPALLALLIGLDGLMELPKGLFVGERIASLIVSLTLASRLSLILVCLP